MIKRVLVDAAIGVGLAIFGQVAQILASIVGPAFGFPFPYEMAPEDGSIPADLLTQISWMFALASIEMLVLTFAIGWLLKVRGAGDGAMRGAVWAVIVGLSQFLLGLADGVVPVFGLVGTWVYLVAIVAGPAIAGVLRGRRLET